MDAKGYDRLPTGSILAHRENLEYITRYCHEHCSQERFFGVMQTSWERLEGPWMHLHHASSETLAEVKAWLASKA